MKFLVFQHYAARHNQIAVCNLLLSAGANVNAQTATGLVTPLHRAAYCGHTSIMELLLQHGADAALCDADGETTLHKV